MGTLSYPERDFVNSDIKTMAISFVAEADAIRDDEPFAHARRAALLRASSFLFCAYAETETLAGFPDRSRIVEPDLQR